MRPQLPEGYSVRYRHSRMTAAGAMIPPGDMLLAPSPKGGETEAKVFDRDGSLAAMGVATCHERDSFNRRIGRDIALGRALKRLAEKQLMTEEIDAA